MIGLWPIIMRVYMQSEDHAAFTIIICILKSSLGSQLHVDFTGSHVVY